VHLIEPINEGQKKALMGLETSLEIPEDAMDVIAQTTRPAQDTTHHNASVKRFKEMVRAPKEKKRIEGRGLASKTFHDVLPSHGVKPT
jgi:hypothetical protein